MSNTKEIKVPDIGDISEADVIEVLVSEGDSIEKEQSLITLETDKATMEVPASEAGVVKSVKVSVGDKVSEGSVILEVEAQSDSGAGKAESDTKSAGERADESKGAEKETSQQASAQQTSDQQPSGKNTTKQASNKGGQSGSEEKDVHIPDIGDVGEVEVIEILVSEGDEVGEDDSLITLESDKATMDVPAPFAGKIKSIKVSVGDKVSEGHAIAVMETSGGADSAAADDSSEAKSAGDRSQQVSDGDSKASATDLRKADMPASTVTPFTDKPAPVPDHPQQKRAHSDRLVHASPAVRRFARELGVDLSAVKGTGPKNRVLKDDVQQYVKYELSRPKATAATGAFAKPEMPEIDHSKWGDVEQKPLTRIQKVSSVNLHRNWISIPHVTQHEDADITELEAFRKSLKAEAEKEGVRLTPLAFVMKALVPALKKFPTFNSSLANDGENLVLKKYFHIGVAVDTPDGLVVPVVRDVDQKSIYQIANELGEMSQKARDKKLSADDMQGSSFTISSLGGIGGTAFTPIVAWPNVAILGLSKNQMKPVWNGREFEPRLMLPMSLSYDHRVIDGAVAARFIVYFSQVLQDIRRILL